jgi:putative addiction module component (TIGR02574 family)
MSPTATSVLQAAMNLPHEERAEVANLLWESVDGFASPEIEAAWKVEIAERLRAIDAGEVQLLTEEDVENRLGDKYGPLFD